MTTMTRRFLSVALAAAAILSVTACANDGGLTASSGKPSVTHLAGASPSSSALGATSAPPSSVGSSVDQPTERWTTTTTPHTAAQPGPAATTPATTAASTTPAPPPPPPPNAEACNYVLFAELRWYSFEASLFVIEQAPDDPGPRQTLLNSVQTATSFVQEAKNATDDPGFRATLDDFIYALGLIANVAMTGTPEEIAAAIASPELLDVLADIQTWCP